MKCRIKTERETEKRLLRSTTVLTRGGVDSGEREREQSAEINCSTHGWRFRLKRKERMLKSTRVLTRGGVDSEREKRERERAEINYSTHKWRCRLKKEKDQIAEIKLQYSRLEV